MFSGVVGSPVTVHVTSEEGLPANMVKSEVRLASLCIKGSMFYVEDDDISVYPLLWRLPGPLCLRATGPGEWSVASPWWCETPGKHEDDNIERV